MTTFSREMLENREAWISNLLRSYTRAELDSMFERVLAGLSHDDYNLDTKRTGVFEAMLNPRSHRYPREENS